MFHGAGYCFEMYCNFSVNEEYFCDFSVNEEYITRKFQLKDSGYYYDESEMSYRFGEVRWKIICSLS